MEYHYFISYFSSDKGKISQQALSNCELTRNKKISNYKDIQDIRKVLEREFRRKDVVILNYILLGKTKEAK